MPQGLLYRRVALQNPPNSTIKHVESPNVVRQCYQLHRNQHTRSTQTTFAISSGHLTVVGRAPPILLTCCPPFVPDSPCRIQYAEDELSDDPDRCSNILTVRHDVQSVGVGEHDHGGIQNLTHSTERRNVPTESGDRHVDQEPPETAERLYEEDELSDNDDGESCGHEIVSPSKCAEDPATPIHLPSRHTPSVLAVEPRGIPEQRDSGAAHQTKHKQNGEGITVATPPLRIPRRGRIMSHMTTGHQQASSEHIASLSATMVDKREEQHGVQEQIMLGESFGDGVLHIDSFNGRDQVICVVKHFTPPRSTGGIR